MVTIVGMEGDFSSALTDLVELEYDAVEAYEAAINRLDNQEYRKKLISFKNDHMRHISELCELLKAHMITPPTGPSLGKQWLAKGKVILGNLVGDLAILRAMRSNEIDTNVAYERIKAREDSWPDSRDMIDRGFADEQRHKKWLEDILEDRFL